MKKKFWKIYKIVVFIILILMATTLSILYLFLGEYEKSIPTHQVDDVISWINNNDKDKLMDKVNIENEELNSKKEIQKNLVLEKGDYFYIKNPKKKKKGLKAYTIYKDTDEIATVYLKKLDKQGLFNLSRYEIEYIDGLLKQSDSITIVVPTGSSVYLNNTLLSDKYIKDKEYLDEKIGYMSPYVEMDKFDKYIVDNVYNPKVKVKYKDKEKEIVGKDNTFNYVYDSNDDLLNSNKEYIETFLKKYTRYVVKENPFSAITPYILSTSNAYSFLKKIAMTNLWSGDHTPTEFSEFKYSNMQFYNDKAFSVEINYTYKFVVQGTINREFDTNITLYMVKQNDKWYVVGLNTY